MAYSAVFLTLDNTKPVHGFPCPQESAPCPLDIYRLIAYIEMKYESAGISTETGAWQAFFVIRKGPVYYFLFLINYAKIKTEIVRWAHIGSPLCFVL